MPVGPAQADHHNDARAPQQAPEAEAAVLGAMMLDPAAIAAVLPVLDEHGDDYYRSQNQDIHRAIVRLYSEGVGVDPVTVADALARSGDLARVGGAPYLHTLVGSVATTGNVRYHAAIVAEKAAKRRIAAEMHKAYQEAMDDTGDAASIIDYLANRLAEIGPRRAEDDLVPLADLWQPAVEEVEAIAASGKQWGVPTGLRDVDDLTTGLHGGQFVIIAARPALGKSTLALDFARAAASSGTPTVFFSLEMGRLELTQRLLSAESRVPLHAMRTGTMTDENWNRLARRAPEVAGWPLWIDDAASGITMASIRAKARRIKQKYAKGGRILVIIDYLQLMTEGGRVENRQQEVSSISRAHKLLAKELDSPVVGLSQLNRGAESRSDRKPLLSDLRESGSLEQDADVVMLLHREDVYEKESPRAGEADIIVAKHRNGPTGTITCAFQGHYSRFVDMAA